MGLELVTSLSTIVGKAKFQYLKPMIGLPLCGSWPLCVELEM